MGTNITGIGNANAIGFKSRVTGGMYFPPELKDALVGVWSAYGKSNDSTDRNIIKNKIKDRGGDFELINFNYEGTSGYNGYPIIFGKDKTYQYVNHSPNYNQTTINVTHFNTRQALLYSYIQRNGELTSYNRDYPSYKIKVSGLEEGFGLMYQYNSKADATSVNALRIEANGIYTIPKSFASDGSLTNANIWVGFVFTGTEQEQCNVTIEVLPEYKGAVVTDGVDDMIISTKTVSEMLEGSNEVTVISMIRQIKNSPDSIIRNNWMFRPEYYLENRVSDESIGKSGIYGYTSSNISGAQVSVINNILGDKNDYTGNSKIESTSLDYFSVEGFRHSDGNMWYLSQVAWYWTFIAKRVLTEDEINLIIEKYNLDRPGEIVKPDVYYDIKRQKITNENHSSFDDELTDFSGNGHNMKLYNIAWEGNSGIGNYPVVFGANKTWKNLRAEDNNLSYKLIANSITVYKVLPNSGAIMWTYIKENEIIREIEIPSFTVKVSGTKNGDRVRYYYVDENSTFKNTIFDITEDGIYVLPKCNKLQITESTPSTNIFIGFVIILNDNPSTEVTIEVIPSNENAICLDGVDDYGKVTGLPIYKDYTVAALRKWLYDDSVTSTQTGSIVSKSKFGSDGAFIFEQTLNKNPSRSSTWCFGLTNSLINNDKLFEESFTYQTKYSYNNNPIQPGTGFDRDSMWLGSVRDNDSRYSKMAIWSLLLFPYSLSEFLLERQIKKARAGTLYPNQVEFRPIIPEDENITRIDYFVVNSGTWIVIKPGDYVDVGARIVLNVYTKLPYKIAGASSTAFTGMTVGPSTALNVWDVKGYIKDKTPQKIKLTLAVNEDIVQWNPTISANIPDSYDAVTEWFINGWETKIAVGDWIKKTDRIFFKLKLKEPLQEIGKVTFGGSECQATKVSNWSESNNLWEIVTYSSVGDLSQVFNIQVDEYIRYEDIPQPYPALLTFHDGNFNNYTYGDKVKLNSIIKVRAGFNLFPDLYTINSYYLNGEKLSFNALAAKDIVVTNDITLTAEKIYKLEGSAPKCIFSPSKLRMPNSSYSYLGYIPDISGNGNNGVFNNFAFSGMSGANGYTYEYTNTSDFSVSSQYARAINSEKIEFFRYINRVTFYRKNPTYKGKIKIEGLTNAISSGKVQHFQIYTNSKTNTETHVFKTDGTYDIDITGIGDATTVYFYVLPTNTSEPGTLDNLITIEQIGNYEGSICFDGVDDYIKIDTTGGMTMLMKANVMSTTNKILYDQRDKNSEGNLYKEFAVLTSNSDSILAYAGRNKNGKTYIDGVLNTNITCGQLLNITHNITALPESNLVGTEQGVRIGASATPASYCKAAVFDFMLFDTKCTNDVIKQLNNIIGIEGDYVQKPSYYWDAYGKNNFSDDRTYLENLVNPTVDTERLNVTNTNWDKLSGYGGYSFKSFNDSADAWNIRGDGTGVEIISRDGYSMTIKKLVQNLDWNISNNEYRYPTILNSELPFKCKSNKNVGLIWQLKYKTEGATSDTTVTLLNQQLTPNVPLEVNLPYKTQEELTELGAVPTSVYYLLYFSNTTLAIGEEYTVEMLPLYPNGLVLDGVDDYLENLDIPALSDFTVITKRTNLLEEYGNNVSYLVKGIAPTGSRDWALFMEYWYDKLCVNFIYDNSVGNYITPFDSIGFVTPTSYNGLPMTKGISNDTAGLRIARRGASYWNGVFYKLMLYPRTTNMLTINMIKNMMAEDGIIDVQGKLFTDKYTGDFYNLDFNKDFLIGN